MAATSSGDDDVQREPLRTIGAQDLITSSICIRTGLLRKQCALQRTFKFLKWPAKFVIVSCGCIYLYKDEYSKSSSTAVSLSKYRSVVRFDDQGHIHWAFKLTPCGARVDKVIIFSCTSDAERKAWMQAIKNEMYRANFIAKPVEEAGLDEYVMLEQEITTQKKPIDPDIESENSEDEYCEIDETAIRPPMLGPQGIATLKPTNKPAFKPADPPRYVVPTKPKTLELKSKTLEPKPKSKTLEPKSKTVEPKSGKNKSKLPTPPDTPPATPKPIQELSPSSISRAAFEYSGSDRQDVESILLPLPDGTFLVRKSNKDDREVLSVTINGLLKEFKIYYKQGQYTIDHNQYFPTTEALLANYHTYDLPNKQLKLRRAYSITDTGYINVPS